MPALRRRLLWAAIFLAAALLLSWLVLRHALAATEAPTAREALDAATAAGDWLVRTQRDDGAYLYLYDPVAHLPSQDDYSFVRHAGVVWSLLELHRRTGRRAYLDSAARGLSRMEQEIGWDGDAAYLVSRDSAPLGGAALAVAAYLALPDLTPQQRKTVAGLGRMILRLQQPDGSFKSHYPVPPPLRSKEIPSIYYPGEALLALTRLHAHDGDAAQSEALHSLGDGAWLEAARKAARYLATERDRAFGYREPAPDHWYVIAAAELVPILRERASEPGVTAAERTALEADVRIISDYAFAVADAMIAHQIAAAQARHPDYAGGPDNYDPPRSAPAATRGEALAAACRLADALGRPRARYLAALGGYAQFILRLQYSDATTRDLPHPNYALGAFATSPADPRTRMDYQQHALCCLLGLEALIQRPP